MKRLLIIVLAMVFPVLSLASQEQLTEFIWASEDQIMISDGTDSTWYGVAVTDTVLSPPIYTADCDGYFALHLQLVSTSGTPEVSVQVWQSYNRTAGNFIQSVDPIALELSTTSELSQITTLYFDPSNYIKLAFIGGASNQTDTYVRSILRRRRARERK